MCALRELLHKFDDLVRAGANASLCLHAASLVMARALREGEGEYYRHCLVRVANNSPFHFTETDAWMVQQDVAHVLGGLVGGAA